MTFFRIISEQLTASLKNTEANEGHALPHLHTNLCRGGGSYEVCLVGHLNVPGPGVGLRVDGDGGDPETLGGAHDPAGDLAAVGDQQLSKYI